MSQLLAEVSPKISKNILGEENSRDFETNIRKPHESRHLVLSYIHESSYFNHHLYKETYYAIIARVALAIFLLIIGVLYALPFVKLISSEVALDFALLRIVLTLLSFTLLWEFIDDALKSRSSSKLMLELDNELQKPYSEIGEEEFLIIFNKFISTKEQAPNISSKTYRKNEGKLNIGWGQREDGRH